jgi:Zn-dependent peptidase ImmA (M78 family)
MFKITSFKNIELRAENVLFAYKITECPADHMKIIMDDKDIKFAESNRFSDEVDGYYMVSKTKKAIIINKNVIPAQRKNFTIAHELGHHFLKHCVIGDSMECKVVERSEIDDNFSSENKRKEQEANVFASCFLMPKEMIMPIFQEALKITDRVKYGRFYLDNQPCNISDWQICCALFQNQFKVTKTALKWRLYFMGILDIKDVGKIMI